MTLFPAPKPEPRPPKARKPMNARNAKRDGSMYPKRRDRRYRRWVWQENPCLLEGKVTRGRLTDHDVPSSVHPACFQHRCWGVITPAHVGEHAAQGAPDVGVLVPLCQAAHDFYDHRRTEWAKVTGLDERKMAHLAEGYTVKYVERGGQLVGPA